jgi:hypothetical protein
MDEFSRPALLHDLVNDGVLDLTRGDLRGM